MHEQVLHSPTASRYSEIHTQHQQVALADNRPASGAMEMSWHPQGTESCPPPGAPSVANGALTRTALQCTQWETVDINSLQLCQNH